mmetsp:Transcript_112273/g.241974  ORF Transcript_112273/g.241974 Transcript_112273/m.241974 type:complete len:269 (-) Transcript_112273:243-1049(-)
MRVLDEGLGSSRCRHIGRRLGDLRERGVLMRDQVLGLHACRDGQSQRVEDESVGGHGDDRDGLIGTVPVLAAVLQLQRVHQLHDRGHAAQHRDVAYLLGQVEHPVADPSVPFVDGLDDTAPLLVDARALILEPLGDAVGEARRGGLQLAVVHQEGHARSDLHHDGVRVRLLLLRLPVRNAPLPARRELRLRRLLGRLGFLGAAQRAGRLRPRSALRRGRHPRRRQGLPECLAERLVHRLLHRGCLGPERLCAPLDNGLPRVALGRHAR